MAGLRSGWAPAKEALRLEGCSGSVDGVKYQTKFVLDTDPDSLTRKVNAEERDGWEFVSVQHSVAPATDPANQKANFYNVFLATLRKEVQDQPRAGA